MGLKIDKMKITTLGRWLENVMTIDGLKGTSKAEFLQLFAFTLLFIWKERNDVVFQKKLPQIDCAIHKIRSAIAEFRALHVLVPFHAIA